MTFERILGHDRQKKILKRALVSQRLSHAYLFEGPDGIGKRLMALALTRAVFCLNGTGCGDCPPCKKVDHLTHPDLHILEADGTQIKIEQVRTLQKELAYRPLEADRKVCIIDGAEKLNNASGNALLKTLEEPTGNALFILISSKPEAMLITIRSRCQNIPFYRLSDSILKNSLIASMELDETSAHILTALSEGSFKKALGKDRELYLERRREILKSITALTPESILPLFDLAEELGTDKEQLPEILEIIQAFYRDILLHLNGCPKEDLVNVDLLAKIQKTAQKENVLSILAKLHAITANRNFLERNVNKQLAMEILLMKLAA